ncbi:hypothetical protein CHLRE_13g590400v5 [Chlamydomonas reinhardtii]|uniref:Fibronectin type-III domain-containing protein n=1 Tax=Chlamydomonas reinhardtii TaxID=3055 RepID=A8IW64_CHLRE|nr:uncharacterized protein CHLRE_13g590400v5 [Chlamydomonas reinhardtii]PNW74226.1 hypothetical protein CHLRE_13g590400v5 [Chlamydomonas reinhardtii]|eukprot:XP_001692941.1 predicted protein [Chlamydomonas reinhardtii]
MSWLSSFRRLRRKASKELAEFRLFLIDFLLFSFTYLQKFCYDSTLPVTKRLFSRKPRPPKVQVKDVRCKRIRLQIDSTYASPFNVEDFEVEWRPAEATDPPTEWTSVGRSDLTARTVARLKQDTPYEFRVRAWNELGCSGWTAPVPSRTKIDPTIHDGGGYGPGGPDKSYSWSQTATEVCVSFKLPPGASKRDIALSLKPDRLGVSYKGEALLEGELYGSVRSWENGSFWELTKEKDHMLLAVTLEKQVKSLAPKFDFWRSLVTGHPEIDTHQIVSEANQQSARMLDPGQLDPVQLQNMGLGHLSGMGGGGGRPSWD